MKKRIPKHLVRMVWERYNGQSYTAKCNVTWCNVVLSCMSSNWHVGHNIPESWGGRTCINNLRPICSDCNLGMGARMTIDSWDRDFSGPEKRLELVAAEALCLFVKRKRKRTVSIDKRPSKRPRLT